MTRQDLVDTTAMNLNELEHSLDQTTAHAAKIVADLVAARRGANLGINIAAKPIAKLGAVLSTLTSLRDDIADAHRDFEAAGRLMGVRPSAYLGGDKNPSVASSALREVA